MAMAAQPFESSWNEVTDLQLVLEDLPEVLKATSNLQAKWESFATALGVNHIAIENIRQDHTGSSATCLSKVLVEWLKKNYNTQRHGHPSWRKICEATACQIGGNNKQLAEEIAEQHPQKKSTIDEEKGKQPEGDMNYHRPRNCGCGKCTIQSILKKDCPSPNSDLLPIFSFNPAHKLVGKYDMHDRSELKDKTEDMYDKFKKALIKTYEQLRASKVPDEEVIVAVNVWLRKPNAVRSFQHEDKQKHLLKFLDENIPWFQHTLMFHIIEQFLPKKKNINKIWRDYTEDLKKYAENRVEEYEGVEFGMPPSRGRTILWLAIDDEMIKMKLSDVHDLRRAFCKILGPKPVVLYFYAVNQSSIILEFVVSQLEERELISFSINQLHKLINLNIISLHIEDTHVYTELELWNPLTKEDATLDESDCNKLTGAVLDIKKSWRPFSRKLGLTQQTLHNIQANSQDCLRDALTMWLRREGYSQKAYGPPTFARLCSAVANPMGGQNEELAKKLASTLELAEAIVKGNRLMFSLFTSIKEWLPKRKQTVDSLNAELSYLRTVTAVAIVGGTGAGALAGLGIGAVLSLPTGGASLIVAPLLGAFFGLTATSTIGSQYLDRRALNLGRTQVVLDNDRRTSNKINTQLQSINEFFESTHAKLSSFNKEEIIASAMEYDLTSHQDSSTETRNRAWRKVVLSKARKLFRDPGIFGQRLQTENLPADLKQLILDGLEKKVGDESKAAKDLSTCTTNLKKELNWGKEVFRMQELIK